MGRSTLLGLADDAAVALEDQRQTIARVRDHLRQTEGDAEDDGELYGLAVAFDTLRVPETLLRRPLLIRTGLSPEKWLIDRSL